MFVGYYDGSIPKALIVSLVGLGRQRNALYQYMFINILYKNNGHKQIMQSFRSCCLDLDGLPHLDIDLQHFYRDT